MPKSLKAVIDTNVIISAIIGIGPVSRQIFNAFVNGRFTPIISDELMVEIRDTIKKPRLKKYFQTNNLKRFQDLIKADAFWVNPTKTVRICRDAKDNFILETALAAHAHVIVTNDEDLLVLKNFHSIPILKPKDFIHWLK